jgi:hypothetical protein
MSVHSQDLRHFQVLKPLTVNRLHSTPEYVNYTMLSNQFNLLTPRPYKYDLVLATSSHDWAVSTFREQNLAQLRCYKYCALKNTLYCDLNLKIYYVYNRFVAIKLKCVPTDRSIEPRTTDKLLQRTIPLRRR